jgi:peptidoglycan/LPS O-acetylase OafA/YrhL
MVMISHLWNESAWWHGAYAVFGFYLLSGYLMTLVLNEVYDKSHIIEYGINRCLRVFPIYWFFLLLTLLAVSLLHAEGKFFFSYPK